ncbi:MAG: response regulator transcription factor [Butyrivibrio sp.]|nr:response regulator transcription factor [Acetatifactor muris]MCM1560847.1 response regulator transcription factor [Butyrivibrio sp.]
MKSILIIDDDVYIGNALEETLIKAGYRVSRAYSGTEALLVLSGSRPDLVLLDLMLPGLSGEEVLPQIEGIPVIILSAKADIDNKVGLLLGGAVDYVTKPFNTKELLARIAVQLRNSAVTPAASILTYDDITLDTKTHTVTIATSEIKLTRTEYAILRLLMQNPTQVITKSGLLDRISEDTPDCTENSLKTHISHLRAKLREVNGKEYIEAVWGMGFKMKET